MYISPDNLLKVLQLRKSAISSFKERRIGEIYEGKRKKRKFSLKTLRFVPRYETEDAIWKAVRVQSAAEIAVAEQLGADALVLEGYVPGQVGGTGQTADWNLIAQARPKMPFFLAGGLRLENLEKACQQVQPDGVDLASGAETDGVKDFEKMKAIVEYIRGEKAWKK